MPVKDYYKLLQIEHNADLNTIKKAYRNLAMQYHPDKHGDNQSTQFYFREIQEAYETLSDPEKRENYHYQIWLEKSMGHQLDSALTAEQIIQLFISAEKAIHEADTFSTNSHQLLETLMSLYNQNRLELILERKDSSFETTTLMLARKSAQSLPSTAQLKFINQLKPLLSIHLEIQQNWLNDIALQIRKEKIERLKIPLLIIITLILCLAILLLNK
ncbi:MAG: hypothetical protein RL642_1180 [Bacteroidota bacterium]|jgi:curved DNA-binding protein CbpA